MRAFTWILLTLIANTEFSVQALQYSVTLARRQAAADHVDPAKENCETALGFQRSLHVSHRQPHSVDADNIHKLSKFEDVSVFGLQRSTKVSKRRVNPTTSAPLGVQSDDGAVLGLQRSTQLKKRAATPSCYFDVEPSCLLGLQQSMEINRRGAEDAGLSLLGLSTFGLQRSVHVTHFKAVA